MKVLNAYIVKVMADFGIQLAILFECENEKWFVQTEVLQNEWMTSIEPLTAEEATKLLETNFSTNLGLSLYLSPFKTNQ